MPPHVAAHARRTRSAGGVANGIWHHEGMSRAAGDHLTATRSAAGEARADEASHIVLVVSAATGARAVVLEPGCTYVLGRAPDCDVVVDDPSVSRRHARIAVADRAMIEDLGSRNGTRVGGQRLATGERQPVPYGHAMSVGDACLFAQRQTQWSGGLGAPASGAPEEASATRVRAAPHGVVLESPAMRRLYDLVGIVAPTPLPILLLGPTGAGKEVVAEAIHARSGRATKPFLRINAAALAESILESELFGHEKGAFTGAAQARKGVFEEADTGTLFLDEIGEMPLSTQAKLLRVLESGEVQRLGSARARVVDVRIVAATNRELPHAICAGAFRSDLYFRLLGMSLRIPPLRERPEEIVPLAEHFVARYAVALRRPAPAISEAAKQMLLAHPFPGNVRELRRTMERAVALVRGTRIDVPDLHLEPPVDGEVPPPQSVAPPAPSGSFAAVPSGLAPTLPPPARLPSIPPPPRSAPPSVEGAPQAPGERLRTQAEALERATILEILQQTQWVQTEAARLLGMSARGLANKLDRLGIERPRKRLRK
jgi:transcriptional regulator with GAF, ATPase, and Fis domain